MGIAEATLGELPIKSAALGGAAGGLLEPVEHLRGRVDLVVVLALRERGQLVQVFGEPCRLFGRRTKSFSIIAVGACMLSAKQSFA